MISQRNLASAASYNTDEEEAAWKKVTPVDNPIENSESSVPKHTTATSRLSSGKYVAKNLSEGELSDSDDVEVLSSGKRSNYTNTSIIKIARGHDDDASS